MSVGKSLSVNQTVFCLQIFDEVRNEVVVMDNNKLLRYSIQLSMLKQLLIRKLIDDKEYKRILHALMRDYGVISDLNA